MTEIDRASLDVLAGEYVLGTLSPELRQQFGAMMASDAGLRALVDEWEDRLAPLALTVEPMAPPTDLWDRIATASGLTSAETDPPPLPDLLGHDEAEEAEAVVVPIRSTTGSRPPGWLWNSVGFWRGAALAAGLAALVALGLLANRPDPKPIVTAYDPATQRYAALVDPARATAWVAHADLARGRMVITPVEQPSLAQGSAFELWVVGAPWAKPLSLGVVAPTGAVLTNLPPDFKAASALAISIEPAGGSPTGSATGPIQWIGPLFTPGKDLP